MCRDARNLLGATGFETCKLHQPTQCLALCAIIQLLKPCFPTLQNSTFKTFTQAEAKRKSPACMDVQVPARGSDSLLQL